MENKGIHAFVSGRVQGVWFRANTQKMASSLGLTGWVRNLDDGRVEVMAFGDAETLQKLVEWLGHGPEKAEVTDLVVENVAFEEHSDFRVT